jgi:hypothetical protein
VQSIIHTYPEEVPVANKCRESACGLNFKADTPPALLLLLVLLFSLWGKATEANVASGKLFTMEEGFHNCTVPSNNPPASNPLLLTLLLPSIPEEAEMVDHARLPNRVEVWSDPSKVGVQEEEPSLVMLRS